MKRRIQDKTDKLFEYIIKFQAKNGFPPSLREMGSHMGISSTSTISYYLNYLEEEGLIRRDVYKNRAIEILHGRRLQPHDGDIDDVDTTPICEIEKAEQEISDKVDLEAVKNYSPIPVLGQITAGQPILATQNCEDVFYMPNNLFRGTDLFILKVKGNSMIEAGIFDGDMVVIKRQDTANNGEIVAALIDDSATVKRFYKENGRFRLQPENPTMEPMYFDEVSIIGKVVGLIRNM